MQMLPLSLEKQIYRGGKRFHPFEQCGDAMPGVFSGVLVEKK